MSGVITGIAGAVIGLGSLTMGIIGNSKAKKQGREARRKARAEELKLEALEASRQSVIDVSDDIRNMKDAVFNPYQNLGIAMQGVDLQMEETDEALANTLDSLSRSGVGAGSATALARQAAMSKASVAATIETQELQNQKLYLQGEQQTMQKKMEIEQAALQEEVNFYGRQETRDIAKLNRLAGLQQGYEQQGMAYDAAGQQALASGVQGLGAGLNLSAAGVAKMKGGGCWVAREVYGINNYKWLLFRNYLFNESPIWFKNIYIKHGEKFAKFISNKPLLKSIIKLWMNKKIKN